MKQYPNESFRETSSRFSRVMSEMLWHTNRVLRDPDKYDESDQMTMRKFATEMEVTGKRINSVFEAKEKAGKVTIVEDRG
ncbi:hypothetical protein LCGC14_1076180 [marine sediment metagenome]|uniref:Uncharacterized protein n=1 Tax=marine sediment metagenome TaxID=412755 RepID=A0A0F9MLF4_9ZZZZ